MKKVIFKIGKTTELIKLSADSGAYIVCKDLHDANRIQNYAKLLGYEIPFPITFHEFKNEKYYGKCVGYGKIRNGFLNDDIEILLKHTTSGTPVSFNLCMLSDSELIEKVDKLTDEMFTTQKVPARHIPARPNDDYDLLVKELIRRFHNMTKKHKTN